MKKNNYSKTIFIVMACVSIFSPFALAGDLYWGTLGTWNTGTPWFSDAARTTAAAWVQGDIAHFDQAATITVPNTTNIAIAGIVANDNVTVTPGSAITTGNLQVSFNVASAKLLNFGTQTLVATAGTTHGIIKDGAGALAITGNGYLGGFTLNSGTVTTKGVNAFGLGALTINGGSIGATGNYAYAAASSLNIRGDFTIGGATAGSGSSTATFSFAATTPVSLGSATRTITMGGTGLVTFQGNMTGDEGVGLTLSSTIISGTTLSPFRLMGDNSGYKGITTINSYAMLKIGSITALGTTDAGTVVNSGGTLDIYGTNYTAAEPVTLTGGSTTAAIANNNPLEATFNGPITLNNYAYVNGAAGKLNLTNTIGGTGTLYLAGVQGGSISGAISMTGSLVVGANWTISGANTYSDATTINATKTLTLGASGVIPDGSGLVLAGTLKTGATVGFSETIGTLTVTDNATIALGTGVHTLAFANSSAMAWTAAKTLTITGWTGSSAEGSTAGKIFVGTDNMGLTSGQLAQITFSGHPAGAKILLTGELYPSDIPTALNNSELQSLNVTVNQDGVLAIKGLLTSTMMNVYNTNGMLLVSKLTNTTDSPIILNQKGIYIVKLADKVFKLIR